MVLMGESIGGAVAVDLAAATAPGRWSWRARLKYCPTWPPIITPGFRSAGLMRTRLDSARRSATTTGRSCKRTATPTRSCRCGSASDC